MKLEEYNGNSLAFIGDALLSLWVREYLVSMGITKSDELQKKSVRYVSANSQAAFMQILLDEQYLTEDEHRIYLRGRNHKSQSKAKNADVVTYRVATGFEALVGYLYLAQNENRLRQIWDKYKTIQG
jgi:ribonuclease-3 family protein